MNFTSGPEQTLLADSVDRFGREYYDFASWRRIAGAGSGFDRANWRRMAALGWLGLNVPEEHGGSGGSPVDTMVLMGGFGRYLFLEPYVGTCVAAPLLLAEAQPALRDRLLPAIAAGDALISLACAEADGRFDLAHVGTRAEAVAEGWRLHGSKSHAQDGPAADWFIVPARVGGAIGDRDGITLFCIPADAPGLSRRDARSADHGLVSALRLDGVAADAAQVTGKPGDGLGLLERAVDHAIAARLAEAVGVMDYLRDATLDYLKTREQFGVKIGSFQTLQHRMADIAIACEEARAMTRHATSLLSAGAAERRLAVAAAKARVGQVSLFVGRQAVQLHGGMGTSDELAIGHCLKRLIMIDLAFGNADHHLERFAAA